MQLAATGQPAVLPNRFDENMLDLLRNYANFTKNMLNGIYNYAKIMLTHFSLTMMTEWYNKTKVHSILHNLMKTELICSICTKKSKLDSLTKT